MIKSERPLQLAKYLFCSFILCATHLSAAAKATGEMQLKQLSDNVWLHVSYKAVEGFGLVESNGVIVLSEQGSSIIDTPWTPEETRQLLTWAKARGMPVTRSFSSHWHEDRTAGIGVLNENAVATYASAMTNEFLQHNQRPLASHSITEEVFVLAPGIEVFYPGKGHAADNSVVWLEEANILVGGCLIRGAETQTLGYTGDADLQQWGPSVQKVLARYGNAATLVLPGHGEPGDAGLLIHTLSLTRQ